MLRTYRIPETTHFHPTTVIRAVLKAQLLTCQENSKTTTLDDTDTEPGQHLSPDPVCASPIDVTLEKKELMWLKITGMVNAVGCNGRRVAHLKKCWEDMKQAVLEKQHAGFGSCCCKCHQRKIAASSGDMFKTNHNSVLRILLVAIMYSDSMAVYLFYVHFYDIRHIIYLDHFFTIHLLHNIYCMQ